MRRVGKREAEKKTRRGNQTKRVTDRDAQHEVPEMDDESQKQTSKKATRRKQLKETNDR
jgi:hypothetical protein